MRDNDLFLERKRGKVKIKLKNKITKSKKIVSASSGRGANSS